ncbi:Bug family tripartite tricarboxylate transporter substrate binding protein [Alcaligenes faecalis]|uniref:Bug family tripartite tricarboxylate transporter substrate binding protein n=1 Tax=Alcaligenes faecalis TaxID=511 RepID=UPI000F0B52DC|nr:tripartite tricarboxylate transporter substrate binding protein [Alcaligenes faecalis]AYR20700.1 tripartite tricarboxylate transporter substrate binding protein [Alcaligenes faecalis]
MRNHSTLLASISCTLALLGASLPAHASPYPTRSLTIVVPTAPGGGNDAMARIIAKKMGDLLEQPIVVENRPGANGTIASMNVARAKPDGYTLLFGYIATHAINPALQKLPYDPVKDFSPIGEIASSPTLLIVNNKLPVASVQELIEYSNKEGVNLNYASAGTGTAPHAAGALFKLATNANMLDIPYKGSNPAMMDTVAGTTQVMFPSLFSALSHIESGTIRPLATVSDERSEVLPDLPTLRELGIDVSLDQWYALFAPSGTQDAVITKLNAALNHVLQQEEVRAVFSDQGAITRTGTPEALGQLVMNDWKKWQDVVAKTGIHID